jgi:hypothetical protein
VPGSHTFETKTHSRVDRTQRHLWACLHGLRKRIQKLKARQSGLGAFLSNVFNTPQCGGGLFCPGTIQPIVFGEEIALVKQSAALCLGRIGAGCNICLKLASECTTEAHAKKKGTLLDDPCLVVTKGDDKGYENVVLDAQYLDDSFINELLQKTDVNWPSEFAKIEANDTRTASDRKIIEDVLMTAKKHRNFASPAKKEATDIILDKLNLLETTITLMNDAGELMVNTEGEVEQNFDFDAESYAKFSSGIFDKLDIVMENACVMGEIILGLQPFVDGQVKPIENLLSGLRTEIASLTSLLGDKDLGRKDVPLCLWTAIESGFDSILKLENKLSDVAGIATESHEVASALLSLHEEVAQTSDNPKSGEAVTSGEDYLNNLSKPRIINGTLFQPTSGSNNTSSHDLNGSGSNNGTTPPTKDINGANDPSGNGNCCDSDEHCCGYCITKFHELESKITAFKIRVSNLEDTKNGNIESALLVKGRVYRGRSDIRAELDKWFPEESGKRIDAGLFPTPHLILNLIHADICSKQGPTLPIDQNYLIKHQIRRSDADAYYALKSAKPEFMLGKDVCPNFTYKATKAQRNAAKMKFLPSHEDFGNGLESDSLHYKFKQALHHIRGERERYIESVLGDHPDFKVISVAKQLLDDSCKFVTEMLSFMDEVYASCVDSFGASTEAWTLVCHCVEELFTKELKPSLKYNVGQDLNNLRNTLVGVVHSAFSLNCKVRKLNNVRLKNHHSTTTSHVWFVMKMAKTSQKSDAAQAKASTEKTATEVKLQAAITQLQKENKDLKSYLQRLESKLDSVISKNDLEVATKSNSSSKRSRTGAAAAARDGGGEEKSGN